MSAHAIMATLDTKGEEVAHLARLIADHGGAPHVIDVGVLGESGHAAAVSREEVARLGGGDLRDLQEGNDPAQALTVMAAGARRALESLAAKGGLAAVIGVAGGKGAGLFDTATEALPVELPKFLVSSARAPVIAGIAAKSGTVVFPTVVDLMGLNPFTRRALAQVALLATATPGLAADVPAGTTVAVTSFGVTTTAAMRCVAGLRDLGLEPLVLPANGAGGRLLERLIAEGGVDAVLDLTTTEIADELVGGHASAGEGRLTAAGAAGIPHWVAPGAVDMVNFGPPETVPARFEGRTFYRHSDHTTLMRTTAEENREIGRVTATRVAAGTGPRCLAYPTGGVSDYDQPGRPFFDPQADTAWLEGARAAAGPDVDVVVLDCHVNDPAFADHAVGWLARHLDRAPGTAQRKATA